MRITIAGAGNVGRSIARELLGNGHQVLLIERDPAAIKTDSVPGADWLLADACEIDSLEEARLDECDVAIAATGDDKANLVHALIAKTEFSVPRTVGRVNHPSNEWMFDEVWGVDIAVSMPRLMSAMVEEAVGVGDLVHLHTFKGDTNGLVVMTLPFEGPHQGRRLAELSLPGGFIAVAYVHEGRVAAPTADTLLTGGDEIMFVGPKAAEHELADYLAPNEGRVLMNDE